MNPLSTKTLTKMYIKAGISEKECALLRKYLLCFSNLYGSIQISELWKIFKQYEEKISKEKFFAFIDISQREENDYFIFNLNEAYTGETSAETADKFLVNKWLIRKFSGKFSDLIRLEEFKDYRYGFYIPDKEELFEYDHDIFYETDSGKAMRNFISNLKTTGIETDRFSNEERELLDLDGNKVKGKRFKDVICFNHFEEFMINYPKRENEKEYLRNEYSVSCAKKTEDLIKRDLQIGDGNYSQPSIGYIIETMENNYGADIDENSLNKFLQLYMDLNNKSHRWQMCGYSPESLQKLLPKSSGPVQLQFGPNIQKMIDSGEYDLKEMEKMIRESGLNVILPSQSENATEKTYSSIVKDNSVYLGYFEEFLNKRHYSERQIDLHFERVEYYINDYLLCGTLKSMKDGCSLDVYTFIKSRVNEKVMPFSAYNVSLYLASISMFYECMAERKLIDRKTYTDFKKMVEDIEDKLIDDYYMKHPKTVELMDVIEIMEFANDGGTGYININTGDTEFIPDDPAFYDGDVEELYEKIEGPEWKEAPEFDEYEIMNNFSLSIENKWQSDKLYHSLHKKKAFRNFKNVLYEMHLEKQYYDYRDAQIEEIAKKWIEENSKNGKQLS